MPDKTQKFDGRELGKLDSDEYPDFDKVVSEKGVMGYRDLKYDEQIKFCLIIKKFLILAPGYNFLPFDNSSEAKKQSDFVSNNLTSLGKPLGNILFQILSAIEYGYSVSEKLWVKENNQIFLSDIKTKLPWDIGFKYDDYGNLIELDVKDEKMPIEKFIIYSFMEQFGNKSGESDLKAVYNAWWFKNIVWKFWARHLERFGSPIVKGKVPPGATTEQTNKFHALINRLHHIVGIILPRSKMGESFDFELIESKREGGNQFVEAIDNADSRISRGLLMPRLIGATKESFGSYALGIQQFNMVYKFLGFIASSLAEEVINKQIIKQLIDYNFAKPLYPKFQFKELSVELVKEAIGKTPQ